MNQERRQVLDMLAQGKITPEDAERLLGRLEALERTDDETAADGPREDPTEDAPVQKGRLKYLRVLVNSKKGEQVNIRVPLAFLKAGVKLTTIVPTSAKRRLEEEGFDLGHLSQLKGEELDAALRELKVDVDSSDGEKVRIFCE